MSRHAYVVAEHNPRRKWLFLLLVVLALLITAILSRFDSLYQLRENRSEIAALHTTVDKLAKDNAVLSERIIQLNRTLVVLQEAQKITATDNKLLQGRVYDLKKDISLYKRVLKPPKNQLTTVEFASIDMMPLSTANRYHYSITMVQLANQHRLVRGRLQGKLTGVNAAGEKLSLEWRDLLDKDDTAVRFRHYHELTGTIKLPTGFSPESIQFKLDLPGRNVAVQKTFLWLANKEILSNVQIERESDHT